ncbi:hypothetical protein QE152_g7170 [Popillia japonica]|uniref:Uncharacterized protein n=1 Tax=Popillia japonica TaxID=7064 RepID=A0AAW1MFR7_POPJA
MLGSRSGLATLVKEKNSFTVTMHCIIHRQALASKTQPEDLSNTMHCIIHRQALASKTQPEDLSNTMKSYERKLCAALDSEYETLLFHTAVRWMSNGNMLARLYELREELKVFFIEMKMQHFLEQSSESTFVMQLAYLVDIFGHLNQLNLQLQGSGNETFEAKEEKNFQSFPTLKTLVDDGDYATVTDKVQHNILRHLGTLMDEFARYFPEYSSSETEAIKKLIRNPLIVKPKDIPDNIQEEVIELQNDSNFKDSFESGVSLEEL